MIHISAPITPRAPFGELLADIGEATFTRPTERGIALLVGGRALLLETSDDLARARLLRRLREQGDRRG